MPALVHACTRCAFVLVAFLTFPFAAERWTQFSSYTEFTSIADDGANVWIGSRGGLIRVGKAAADTEYFNQINSPLTDSRIRNLASDGKGGTAAVTYGGCLAVFEAGAWEGPEAFPALRGQSALDAAWDRPGSLWVLTNDQGSGRLSLFHRRNAEWYRTALPQFDSISIWGMDFDDIIYSVYSQASAFPRLQVDTLGRAWVSARSNYQMKMIRIETDGSTSNVVAPDFSFRPGYLFVPPSGDAFWLCDRVIARPRAGGWDTDSLPAGTQGNPVLIHPRHAWAPLSDGSEIWSFETYGLYRKSGGGWSKMRLDPSDPLWTSPPAFLVPAVRDGGNRPNAPEAYAAQKNRIAVFAAGEWNAADPSRAQVRSLTDMGVRAGGPHAERIVIASSAGLDTLDSRAGRFLPVEVGVTGLISVFADHEGRIWTTGYYSHGFVKAGETQILLPPDGMWGGLRSFHGNANDFLAEDAAGTLWIADSSRLISAPGGSTDNRTWGIHPLPSAWGANSYIATINAHPDGSIWAAVPLFTDRWSERPARFDGKNWTRFDSLPEDGLRPGMISDLRCDSAGNVWALYPEGLWQWDGGTWKTHSWKSSPLLGHGISAIGVDSKGALWAATVPPNASLLRWADGWQAVPDAGAKLGTATVQSIAGDGTGRLWLATKHDGLLTFNPAVQSVSLTRLAGRSAGDTHSLRRRPDGSWLLDLGAWPGAAGLSVQVLDFRGRAIPGTGVRLTRRPAGGWVWPGPGPSLAPGRYILSIEGSRSRNAALPFYFVGQ